MSKTCFIHIGTPKTGTSSLQATLFAARKELLKNNVNYFDLTENHNLLVGAFERDAQKDAPLMSPTHNTKKETRTALLKAVKQNKSDYFVISGEALSMLTKGGIEDLKKFLDPHFDDFTVAAYVREPFGFASSAAQQLIKSGSYSEKFAVNTITRANPGWGNVLPFYRRRIENYIKVFGKDRMIVKDFTRSKLKNQSIIDDFLHEVLRYQGNPKKIKTIKKNEALDGDLVRTLEKLNIRQPAIIEEKRNPERSTSIIMRLQKFSSTIDKKKYVPNALDVDAFCETIKEDVEWLKKTCDVTFNLEKPDWSEDPIDLGKIAALINSLSLSLDKQTGKRGAVTSNYTVLQTKYEKLHGKYKPLQADFAQAKDNYIELHGQYTSLQKEMTRNKKYYDAQYSVLNEKFTALNDKYKPLQADFAKAKGNYTSLHGQYTILRDGSAKTKENFNARYSVLQGKFTELNDKYKTLQTDFAKAKGNYTSLHGQYTTLRDGSAKTKENSNARYSVLQDKFTELNDKYKTLQTDFAKAKGNYTSLHGQYTTLRDGSTNSKGTLLALQKSHALLNNRYALLNQRILITKGKANKNKFVALINNIQEVELLEATARALTYEKCDDYVELINKRIKAATKPKIAAKKPKTKAKKITKKPTSKTKPKPKPKQTIRKPKAKAAAKARPTQKK